MKVSELRTTNFVQTKGGTPFELAMHGLEKIHENPGCYEPIPLTEEWLLKLGFDLSRLHIKNYLHPATMHFELRNVSVLDGGFKIIAGNSEPNYFKGISKELKYVHELQNFFFASTGEELTIKELV